MPASDLETKAQVHLQAAIEDFDFSAVRGVDKSLVLELSQPACRS